MTNLEKFLEVFGYKEKADNIECQCLCPCIVNGSCEECRHFNQETDRCDIEKFWDSEYKEQTAETPSMSVSEAVAKLTNATFSDEWQGDEELTTAYRMAIDALSKSESYINRFDAIIQLSHDLPNCTLPEINECLVKMPTLRSELK